MNTELKAAMEALEKEKNISQETLFDAIETALLTACRNNFGRTDNLSVYVDRDTCDYRVIAKKTIVASADDVEDRQVQISAEDAVKQHIQGEVGDTVDVEINSQSFGRIATQIAKNVILQKIREEERNAVYNFYSARMKSVVTGVVQRQVGRSWSVNLGKADGILNEKEQVESEKLAANDRIKVYILDVRKTQKGATRILLSRTHPDLVKCLFEEEVAEIRDGTVQIMSIAREAGSRTKIAVWSDNPNVDPVGACVGINGGRVGNIVDELRGEKIDIINWDENPGNLIQNALSTAKIVAVFADPDEKSAKVVVPDYQLSLAIGREGQNARLAARLTGYKIDIKSETQAKDAVGFRYEDYLEDAEGYDDGLLYDENGMPLGEYSDETAADGSAEAGSGVQAASSEGVEYTGQEESEYEEIVYVDENGNPIAVDENGNPIDENGNILEFEEVYEEVPEEE